MQDAKYASLREEIPPTIYNAQSQDAAPFPQTNFKVRTAAADPAAMIGAVKSAIGEVNRDVSIDFTTLAIKVGKSIARERLLATLSGFFGILALLLAAVGLYGVMTYTVARRRGEIGIRMALGAEQARVLRMVLGEAALLTGAGLVAGVGAAAAVTRFVKSFLYGLAPNDPLVFTAAAAVLAGVAVFAGYLPARRAARLDPMTALREE